VSSRPVPSYSLGGSELVLRLVGIEGLPFEIFKHLVHYLESLGLTGISVELYLLCHVFIFYPSLLLSIIYGMETLGISTLMKIGSLGGLFFRGLGYDENLSISIL